MRDVIITLMVFGALPFIFRNPSYGMAAWIWISVMNPHMQGWGFARTAPYAAIIAAVTMLAMLVNRERYRLPMTGVVITFLAFVAWMSVGTLFAFYPGMVGEQLIKVLKIMGMSLVVLMLLKKREHVDWLIWTVVLSLGFYGVKGGIFTLVTGGAYRVWGPSGTFIDGNNEVALALVMCIPLMYYLIDRIENKWGKRAMLASIGLCAIAALGSYSRGAALALGAMLVFMWLKGKHKIKLGLVLLIVVPLALVFMPEQWHTRLDTLNSYEQDASAMGRINAWKMAFNLANDRPMFGGSFEIYNREIFSRYAPVPDDVHAAHSIYFQVLGEHGWVGFGLYLLLGFLTWRAGSWVLNHARYVDELQWACDMVRMIQVSLLGFMVGGAFLSLAYFDVPYYLMAALVAVRLLVEKELAQRSDKAAVKEVADAVA
ncbi:putative O-glycosylation ligase, exosortase A system-associated [Pseudoduganella eburnea]|uniref:Putative O-glycosylation ligase, exosortase A system-associated n=1 Tax=Massilia eburnea TaxID=1776165 RepID=A0A6L6QQX2_9BURK|nr:putative O-glycosylation ligase, exosortase A system-associated [Massilia eburnea]MTW14076.1 putative O-glycosylation ligase, exosortase A system-associated [Massilia eburnea]